MILVMYAVIFALLIYSTALGIGYIFAAPEWISIVSMALLPFNVTLLLTNLDALLDWWERQIMDPIIADEGLKPFGQKTLWQE